jgi:hypothetical protein
MATRDISDMQVCEACAEARANQRTGNGEDTSPLNVLITATHEPLKVCRNAMRRAELRGLIDGQCRLTSAGRQLLKGNGGAFR